jgi:hypothetical protein
MQGYAARPDELLKWSPKDMDSLEVHDETWVARFGRLRALHYLDKLRALAVMDEGGEGFGGKFTPLTTDRSRPHSRAERTVDDDDDVSGARAAEGGAVSVGVYDEEDEDADADSEVDAEAEHDASLRYAREHASDWQLPLDKYLALTSSRSRPELMSLSGGTFFMDTARKRMEQFESEDKAVGGVGILAHSKTFRDFFDYATPLGDADDAGQGGEDEVGEGEEDSDPETELRRREDALLAEQSTRKGDVDASQSTKKKAAAASQRVPSRARDRPARPGKSKKQVTIATEGDEAPGDGQEVQSPPSTAGASEAAASEQRARAKSPKSSKA